MVNLQEWIHRIEEGPYMRYLRIGLLCLALVSLWVGYNWRCYRNMNTLDAMDSAQVARNLAEGRGFTTHFVRPLSIYFVKHRNEQSSARFRKQPRRTIRNSRGCTRTSRILRCIRSCSRAG